MTDLLPARWRWPYALWWLAVATLLSIAELRDYHREGGTRLWEPVLWEFSSVLCVAALALAVHALVGRLRRRRLRVQLTGHALGLMLYIGLHVGGMFGLRLAAYSWAGVAYDTGDWGTVLIYEGAKDAVSYLSLLLISRGVWVARASAEQQRELDALRLARLADQIQPHFLFNTLNLVSSVMYEDVPRADRLLCQLADLLRQTLAAQARSEHTLNEELTLVQPFLTLMQERFGPERLSVRMDVDDGARDAVLPALLLLTPIENAIKHDVARHPGPLNLCLRARREDRFLRIEIHSQRSRSAFADEAGGDGGLGLRNLSERLGVRYGGQAEVEFQATATGARLRLALPQDAP